MNSNSIISVERAVRDLRAGIPVIITDNGGKACLVASAETCAMVEDFSYAAITPEMAGCLDKKQEVLVFPVQEHCNILTDIEKPAWAGSLAAPASEKLELITAALKLHKISSLIPLVLISDAIPPEHDYLATSLDDIAAYAADLRASYSLVTEANVPLHGAGTVRVLSFRPQHGGLEQLAIITGDISKVESVPVRLHSSCLTGDIFGSMRCDCGEQLRKAIIESAEAGGGVVLYLNQEGRGIGISNKLRAYNLQDSGHNTYDANLMLGFSEDERDFEIAAAILKSLGISRIKLMTNNPEKIRQMEQYGIAVEKRLSHAIAANGVNDAYLASKREYGHIMPAASENNT